MVKHTYPLLDSYFLSLKKFSSLGQKFVAILDPGMATGEPLGTYPSFEEGDELGVWVLDKDGNPLKGFQ